MPSTAKSTQVSDSSRAEDNAHARELRAYTREIEALKSELAKHEAEIESLHGTFSKLHEASDSLLGSNRWRMGNAIANLLAKITGRSKAAIDTAEHQKHIKALKTKFELSNTVRKQIEQRAGEVELQFCHREFSESTYQFAMDRLTGAKPVTIIIPVYNAAVETKACIESVLAQTKGVEYQLLLINDASTDEALKPLVDSYASLPHVRVIHHEQNQGFVKTANHGMREAGGDVVLLNSDTEVTPRWLQKLVVAAGSDAQVGTVTPLSNAAGAFSVPEAGKENEIPEQLGLHGMARLVENLSHHTYPEAPTGNGFCMYIKAEVMEQVGLFDEDAFGRGYGEENDFCMRAGEKGWQHIIDDATYIYHARSASFGADKEALIAENRKNLDERHPEYSERVKAFLQAEDMATIRARIADYAKDDAPKPRILYVLHQGGGGTPYTNMDLMQHVDETKACLLLTSNAESFTLWEVLPDRKLEKRQSWPLVARWHVDETMNRACRVQYFSILSQLNVDIVHIRHLLGHSFDLPEVAKKMGLHVVMSFHDFYFACPSTHLLDSEGNYCAGNCHTQAKQCNYPLSWLGEDAPHLSSFNAEWREDVARMLTWCDAFVTTTEASKSVYTHVYGDAFAGKPFDVIEHGRDFPKLSADALWQAPVAGEPVHILFPGQLGFNKGVNLIRALKEIDAGKDRLHFHFLGAGSEHLTDLGTAHGSYQRDEFFDKVRAIRPSFVGIFSIWPETYCHTLSEAWACGIPVIASDIGAIKERVENTGAGHLIDYTNPQKTYDAIMAVADNPEAYRELCAKTAEVKLRTTREMADDYVKLYVELDA